MRPAWAPRRTGWCRSSACPGPRGRGAPTRTGPRCRTPSRGRGVTSSPTPPSSSGRGPRSASRTTSRPSRHAGRPASQGSGIIGLPTDQSTYLYPISFTPIQLKTSQKLTFLRFHKGFSAKVNSGKFKKTLREPGHFGECFGFARILPLF